MLRDLLVFEKPVILRKWFQMVLETYPEETARFLEAQKDPFANPAGAMLRAGLAGLLDGLLHGEGSTVGKNTSGDEPVVPCQDRLLSAAPADDGLGPEAKMAGAVGEPGGRGPLPVDAIGPQGTDDASTSKGLSGAQSPQRPVPNGMLADLMRLRSVQGFSPSGAVGFVLGLKQIIRELAGSKADARPLRAEQEALDARIDKLALTAFDLYARCREELCELRIREALGQRDAAFRLLARDSRPPQGAATRPFPEDEK